MIKIVIFCTLGNKKSINLITKKAFKNKNIPVISTAVTLSF